MRGRAVIREAARWATPPRRCATLTDLQRQRQRQTSSARKVANPSLECSLPAPQTTGSGAVRQALPPAGPWIDLARTSRYDVVEVRRRLGLSADHLKSLGPAPLGWPTQVVLDFIRVRDAAFAGVAGPLPVRHRTGSARPRYPGFGFGTTILWTLPAARWSR